MSSLNVFYHPEVPIEFPLTAMLRIQNTPEAEARLVISWQCFSEKRKCRLGRDKMWGHI